jgi:ubiquinone/menaquinone biosynthesis C-methylase UbiE
MEITHSYEGLGRDYRKSRQGIPGFASLMVSNCGLSSTNKDVPLLIVEFGVGSGQQTEFVEKELQKAGIHRYKILAYDKSYQSNPGDKPGQLNIIEERIIRGELSDRVVPICFDFDGQTLPIESKSIDFSYMAHVFHHLKNELAPKNWTGC